MFQRCIESAQLQASCFYLSRPVSVQMPYVLHARGRVLCCFLFIKQVVGYLGERNPTGWLHTIQLGEPNCREPEALSHQQNTLHAQYQEVPSTRT
jgi:hypothetical protein